MNDEKPDVEAIVDAMGRMLGIQMNEESRAATILHLDIAFRLASTFVDFPLPDEAEPATVYAP